MVLLSVAFELANLQLQCLDFSSLQLILNLKLLILITDTVMLLLNASQLVHDLLVFLDEYLLELGDLVYLLPRQTVCLLECLVQLNSRLFGRLKFLLEEVLLVLDALEKLEFLRESIQSGLELCRFEFGLQVLWEYGLSELF